MVHCSASEDEEHQECRQTTFHKLLFEFKLMNEKSGINLRLVVIKV